MMLKYFLIFSLLFSAVSHEVHAQAISTFQFVDTAYDLVDTIVLNNEKDADYIIVGYEKDGSEGGNSLIIYRHNEKVNYYPNVLTCSFCQGRGISASTYGGHVKKGRSIAFIQEYFNGRDSVFIDFSGSVPTYQKIVRRAYGNVKTPGPDDAGNYLFTAKQKNAIPIYQFELPIDREDPNVKDLFYIKPLKWRKLE